MLEIKNLHTSIKNKRILKGIDLKINNGEVHAIMGKNGCGKSTLLNTIMGSDIYKLVDGSITYNGSEIQNLEANVRANLGIFLTFQSPYDFFEARTIDILTRVWNINKSNKGTVDDFYEKHTELLDLLDINSDMLKREFNVGFSGGERKRLEVLQLLLVKPKLILLDEIDTGLDIDSVIAIGNTLAKYQKENNATVIIVTHLSTFLKYLRPDKVHVIDDGMVVKSGDNSLATKITEEGYSFILK